MEQKEKRITFRQANAFQKDDLVSYPKIQARNEVNRRQMNKKEKIRPVSRPARLD